MMNFAPAHIKALQMPYAKQATQAACDQSRQQWDGAKELLAKLGTGSLTTCKGQTNPEHSYCCLATVDLQCLCSSWRWQLFTAPVTAICVYMLKLHNHSRCCQAHTKSNSMLHVSDALVHKPYSMHGATTNIITASDTITTFLHLLCKTVIPCSFIPVLSVLVVGVDKKWCSLKAWLWAASTVCSRTMHVPFCSAGALTPFGDLHNYHSPPPPHYPDIGQFSHLYLLLSSSVYCFAVAHLGPPPMHTLPIWSEAPCSMIDTILHISEARCMHYPN